MSPQIEVTTRCNFSCWYCTGRQMEPKDMELEVFEKILASIPKGSPVSLQGEGEPLLWSHFELVLQKYGDDYKFETITNGTIYRDLSKLHRLGVSIDSLDPKVAEQNGRANIDKVVGNALLYRNTLTCPIRILSVDTGAPLDSLKEWCRWFGMEHVVQPLQPKLDYVKFYPDLGVARHKTIKPKKHYKCAAGFVGKPTYWNVDGVALPCCFTKDLEEFLDCDNVYKRMQAAVEPATCSGCQHLISCN